MHEFPKVLIVNLCCINREDQRNASLRTWFADWPRDRLGQIYSGGETGTGVFCGHTYKIGETDRRCGGLFQRLKSSVATSADRQGAGKPENSEEPISIRRRMAGIAERSGIWEAIFRPVLAQRLLEWVNCFGPSVVFCEGYSLSFARLPVMLHRELGLPLCFFTGDDWPDSLYRDSPFSAILRPMLANATEELFKACTVRLANGPDMAGEFERRYGLPFSTLMLCDESSRFHRALPNRDLPRESVSIIYSGGLTHQRWESIVDLCEASKNLSTEGIAVTVTAYVPDVPASARVALAPFENLRLRPPPSHAEVPSVLKGADILFLGESFDRAQVDLIRLSISTKAHLYMMSERPILAYGAADAGVLRYAKHEGWAAVVDRRNIDELARVLRVLVCDKRFRAELVGRGREVASKNHEAATVRERLRQTLAQTASKQ